MITSFRLRDIPLIAKLEQRGISLDIEERLTQPVSLLRSVLLDRLLMPRTCPSTFLLDQQDNDKHTLGLIKVRFRSERPERDIVFISPSLDTGNGCHAIWQRLLNHACIAMAEQGTLRVFARLPAQSDELQLFKTVGFAEYGQEDIFRLDCAHQPTNGKINLSLRAQQMNDHWGLQKLYATLTPRQVQHVEGSAEVEWALKQWRWGEQGRWHSFVWEVDGELLGAIRIRVGTYGCLIRTLLHPDATDQAESLGQAALKINPHSTLPTYFAMRHYESGWLPILPKLGFNPSTSQILLVKHMTVRVRSTPVLIPALEKNAERVAPTAINGQGSFSMQENQELGIRN